MQSVVSIYPLVSTPGVLFTKVRTHGFVRKFCVRKNLRAQSYSRNFLTYEKS